MELVLIPSLSPFFFIILGSLIFKKSNINWSDLYIIYGSGIIIFYTLSAITNVYNALILACLLFFIGLIKICFYKPKLNLPIKTEYLFFIILFLVVQFFLITFLPVLDWDASYSWYSAAKVIKFQGKLIDWENGPNVFQLMSAPGYPKLIPLFSAGFSTLSGVWNELLPKSVLFLFLIHTLIGVISVLSRLKLPEILSLLIFLSLGKYLWNYYIDGYFSLYAGLFVFYLSSFIIKNDLDDLLGSIVSLSIAINLKNEGLLLILIAFICLLIYIRKCFIFYKKNFLKISLFFILFTPFLLWKIYLYVFEQGSGGFFDPNFLHVAKERLYNNLFYIIKEMIYVYYNYNYFITLSIFILILFFYTLIKNKNLPKICFPICLMSILYFGGILFTYLSSNYAGGGFNGLQMHIGQSVERVMFSIMLFEFILIFTLISHLKISNKVNAI